MRRAFVLLYSSFSIPAVYAVVDYQGWPFNFNFGIGYGLTNAADNWTVKSIIEFSF